MQNGKGDSRGSGSSGGGSEGGGGIANVGMEVFVLVEFIIDRWCRAGGGGGSTNKNSVGVEVVLFSLLVEVLLLVEMGVVMVAVTLSRVPPMCWL